MTDRDPTQWVSAPAQVELEIRSLDEVPEGMVLRDEVIAVLGRGAVYRVMAAPPPSFDYWKPIIMERCPIEMSWRADDENDRLGLHRSLAGWIWDEVNDELPEGTVVVDLRYVGPTGCGDDQCTSTDCTLMWDVTDASESTHRVNVPI